MVVRWRHAAPFVGSAIDKAPDQSDGLLHVILAASP